MALKCKTVCFIYNDDDQKFMFFDVIEIVIFFWYFDMSVSYEREGALP